MNILMPTNAFVPQVGGVARSVQRFAGEFRRAGHRVLVAAPSYEDASEPETDVVRVPAVQNFNGSDFSVPMPITLKVARALKTFVPDIVHSHHPFLLGDTALRVAASRGIPAVFTHHTLYEEYTHYVPGDSPRLKRFVQDMVTGYCNLCDAVVAPSESVAALLVDRGVTSRLEVIPTGVDVSVFSGGDGRAFRASHGIPADAFVVGHAGRLAPEKNLEFLARAVVRLLHRNGNARFILVGDGPMREPVRRIFADHGVAGRLHVQGVLGEAGLANVYKAMDVFAFASLTETQGMVLTEAMAAGTPVVAIDASGAREVVRDGGNGRLLPREDVDAFADALAWVASLPPEARRGLSVEAERTAEAFSLPRTAARTLSLYASLSGSRPARKAIAGSSWTSARNLIGEEWKIVRNLAHAAGAAVLSMPEAKEL